MLEIQTYFQNFVQKENQTKMTSLSGRKTMSQFTCACDVW